MHPVLLSFHLGETEVTLRAYSTFYVLAWATAIVLGTVIATRRGFAGRPVLAVFVGAVAAGVLGARLLDLLSDWGYYAQDLSRIYALEFRGFSLYGGLVLALVAGLLLSRAFRLPVWALADSAIPALAAGIGLMRIGCLLNGCCFGTTTSLPWGITYPVGSSAWARQLATGDLGILGFAGTVRPVHPTQLYEIACVLVLCALAVWLLRRRDQLGRRSTPSGAAFLTFALGFTLFRLFNGELRAQALSVGTPGWFYPALYLVVCAGIAVALAARIRQAGPASPRVPFEDRVRA
jgi:phosphatidylglycerol:prolipoprotein diacylglycerol transferase